MLLDARTPERFITSIVCISIIILVCSFAVFYYRVQAIETKATFSATINGINNDASSNDDDGSGGGGGGGGGWPNEEEVIFSGRRIRSFEREGIVIPNLSIDSRECDDFENPQPCNVTDGYVACFECVESRYSLRVCVHVSEPVTIYDEKFDRPIVLRANESPSQGYCLRERLARDIRDMNVATKDGDDSSSAIARARRECSVYNADWLLVRRRTVDVDSSYNFVCRCKYPHLMTNVAGPMSSCSRDVACNGHGHLDDEAHESRSDPFVDGRCRCEPGWIAEYDAKFGGVGPYCREATFAEWPSAFLKKRHDDDIELYAKAIDRAFRRTIEYARRDRHDGGHEDKKVWLPNPCGECELTSSPEGTYFCGDRLDIHFDAETSERSLRAVHLGVRQSRDYLRGNGGRLPNSCVTFDGEDLWKSRVLVQYMSQSWNDGTKYAQELGFFVKARTLDDFLIEERSGNSRYLDFTETLESPRNRRAIDNEWGVIWTYTNYEMREHRARVCEQLHVELLVDSMRTTDLCYFNENNDSWYDFPFYKTLVPHNKYYAMDRSNVKKRGYDRQRTYRCPDLRGLDKIATSHGTEINEREAERRARMMLPICLVPRRQDGGVSAECYVRPELNINHNNPTACVLYDVENGCAVYAYTLWYPRDMNALQFAQTRNISLRHDDPC